MSNAELQNLQSVLRHSLNDDASVYRALVSYLKSSDDTINYNLIGGAVQDWNAVDQLQCEKGANPVHASDCVKLINKCLKGDENCAVQFNDLAEAFTNGLIFDKAQLPSVKKLIDNLGININVSNPIEDWLSKLFTTNATVAFSIRGNEALLAILNRFIVKVKNPSLESGSLEFANAVTSLTSIYDKLKIPKRSNPLGREPFNISSIPPRAKCSKKNQTGGGLSNVHNTYVRFMDNVDKIIEMRGGGEAKSLYQPLSETYNSLVDTLKYQDKKIEDSDDAHIRNLLSELSLTEEKLFKTAEIIKKFNNAKENPETAKLLGGSSVPDKIMSDVYKRFEELETRHQVGAGNIKSILNTIYLALQGKDKNGQMVSASNVNKNLYDALTSKPDNSY
jgi:hypothetical protein